MAGAELFEKTVTGLTLQEKQVAVEQIPETLCVGLLLTSTCVGTCDSCLGPHMSACK